MFRPLRLLLARLVRHGDFAVTDASGECHRFGNGSGTPLAVRLSDRLTERAIALDPQLAFGEAYMHGRLVVEQGNIYDVLALLLSQTETNGLPEWTRGLDLARRGLRRIAQFNPPWRSVRNVAHHYDIDGAIYDLFLDSDRQYSCAYFTPGDDLEQAQLSKKRHIAAKLDIRPGQEVLDIGCGWGGLALYLAKTCGARVTGVTLSREQLEVARRRAFEAGLADRVRFELRDYRQIDDRFDRIVSVGMFEHVGVGHYGEFFAKVRGLLDEDGVALIHTIGRSDGPGFTNPFIAKYIFPGGYFPALSEIVKVTERANVILTDVEVLRLHYAATLKAWRERFVANRTEAVALKGEEFARMWEFYLAGSEAGFRHQGLVVLQLQMTRAIDSLPVTRDYMHSAERRLAMREREPLGQRLAGE